MKVCIFGLGRIGLPIALVCADSGYRVVGIDINQKMIKGLKNGEVPFAEPSLKELLDKHLNCNFIPKHPEIDDTLSDLKEAEVIVIAVGTGFAMYPDKPKLSTLYSIIDQITSVELNEKTVILRVTLPVGTADDIKNLIEKKTGLKEGQDFWFSFVPERLMEGKAVEEERSVPKIIGSYCDKSFEKAKGFFEKIGGEIIRVSNPRTAEFVKLVDNSWRSTRFAFANELAFAAEMNDIDVMEAVSSANRGYTRNQIPIPGPVSGYCLSKDPYLFEFAFDVIAKKRGFNSLWYYGRRANDWLFEKVAEEVEGMKILVAGLSFKEDIDDYRFSHGIRIARMLVNKGYSIGVHDPYLDKNFYTRLPEDLEKKVKKYESFGEAVEEVDTILFTTRHREYLDLDLRRIIKTRRKNPVIVIDLWNMFRNKVDDKLIIYKGF